MFKIGFHLLDKVIFNVNYFAHIFLSGYNERLMFGNFIGDIIDVRNIERLDLEVQSGIELHRFIDAYTDAHSATQNSIVLFKEKHGPYSGVITDIAYDYFLSHNFELYSEKEFNEYSAWVYHSIERLYNQYQSILPQFIPKMVRNKWLNVYSNYHDLNRVYHTMKKRVSKPQYFENVIPTIQEHQSQMENNFHLLFQDLINEISLRNERTR